ncbi:GNAT family N-acetyltransferase [Mucilaginibacter sp. KACC 22773]|uniref:GNAT family N-acetyltransferase n=1 Tax=Mucilaginibacter sp. KACC 22773 TaxID=3025671 RepID=UPI002365B235|nr:GNAT family N-acetyltransferase [Mucilaginibacter sp. KACC 22773]WDF78518.1 GNAT family N-acetyltransferase [Mucilaginibacter sp. KACC 22773]
MTDTMTINSAGIRFIKVDMQNIRVLKAIGIETFNEAFAHLNTPENMEDYLATAFADEKLAAEVNNPCSEFYMAQVDGNIVGYVKINHGPAQTDVKDDNALEVERIYVLKAFHGKKVGQLLFDKAFEIAVQMKKTYIWLGVWEHNAKALAFYKKNGFEVFGSHDFWLGDDLQTDLMMKRYLG